MLCAAWHVGKDPDSMQEQHIVESGRAEKAVHM